MYLSAKEREHLDKIGTPQLGDQPAGTYAKHKLSRLLIDLSWNSSRLEGNAYSLLDTKRLTDLGQQAEGKDQLEAQMILNHKDAIEIMVSEADEIGFNRYTILNPPRHDREQFAAQSGCARTPAARRRRLSPDRCLIHLKCRRPSRNASKVFATAAAIKDPFEQGFFVMVQIPYLQAFDDVNKRAARLAANIPLIKNNLAPLSFADVPKQAYTDAMLGVYELKHVDLLKDIFIWGYERSASRYASVRQSLGEPDPFRLRHRDALRTIVGEVVRGLGTQERHDELHDARGSTKRRAPRSCRRPNRAQALSINRGQKWS